MIFPSLWKTVGGGVDLAVLDTSHVHPWETLNFLCMLPFLKDGAWVVLHDISLQLFWKGYRACRYLWGHVVSENKLTPIPENGRILPNVGAFQITEDTRKYVRGLFGSLTLPWGLSVKEGDLKSIERLIRKYYSEEYGDVFLDIIKFQREMDKNNMKFTRACRTFISDVFPGLYEFIRNLRRRLQ